MNSMNSIETSTELAEVMADLGQDLLANLTETGKSALFQEAIQILLRQTDTAQSSTEALTVLQNLNRLVEQTPELRDELLGDVPDGPEMGFDDETEQSAREQDRQQEQLLQATAGIRQHLVQLVPDEPAPDVEPSQSRFEWLLAQLGLQRIS